MRGYYKSKTTKMKRLIWLAGDRGKMPKEEYQAMIRELAAAVGGEVVLFSKSTPEHEARFMIIGDEKAEQRLADLKKLNTNG